jgi:hypothetical protein
MQPEIKLFLEESLLTTKVFPRKYAEMLVNAIPKMQREQYELLHQILSEEQAMLGKGN